MIIIHVDYRVIEDNPLFSWLDPLGCDSSRMVRIRFNLALFLFRMVHSDESSSWEMVWEDGMFIKDDIYYYHRKDASGCGVDDSKVVEKVDSESGGRVDELCCHSKASIIKSQKEVATKKNLLRKNL